MFAISLALQNYAVHYAYYSLSYCNERTWTILPGVMMVAFFHRTSIPIIMLVLESFTQEWKKRAQN